MVSATACSASSEVKLPLKESMARIIFICFANKLKKVDKSM